ncbi:hypothetical protein Q7C36_007174 [Tachysurus vachellii]|uniref:Uncharacterized protein n=1 Tax=Tachysurus vachellii TaxID=175792 RepID=A0AA88T247_TACVA|nr:hypothetical protein Q7C36_007174 [Tachysurus vachellii]
MYLIRKPICLGMLLLMEVVVWMNPALTEGSPLCCYTVLSNGSVNYRHNMTVNFDYAWSADAIPISDDVAISANVLNSGENSILLNKLHFNVSFLSTAPNNPCDSGKADPYAYVPDSKAAKIASIAAFISVAFVILVIIWKSGRYRRCCANRPEANHANGGFQAVGQVDQQETIV